MTVSATLFQTAAAMPFGQVFSTTLYAALYLALLGGTLMLFRPLLLGIGRALFLTVRPRRSKAELAAQRALDEALMMTRNNIRLDPADAAEVRAMGIRH
jgi:hypothetical protein